MKVNLELKMPDTRIFLNFWHWNGDDIVAEIKDDKIWVSMHDDDGNELPPKEVTITEYCRMVTAIVHKRIP